MNSPPVDEISPARPATERRQASSFIGRESLGFPAQFALGALRRLVHDSDDTLGRQWVARRCSTLGVPRALPALVGLAACLARGPLATRLRAAAADLILSHTELAVLMALRDASAGRRPRLKGLVDDADLAPAALYTHHSACEFEAGGLRITVPAPVIPFTLTRRRLSQ
jgi:hypothetical protein